MPNNAQRTHREVEVILEDHEGFEVKDRWYCKLHSRTIYSEWTTPYLALKSYKVHLAKCHPERVGNKPKITRVD